MAKQDQETYERDDDAIDNKIKFTNRIKNNVHSIF